jgi:peptidoglycan/LPS O-acetylase OafA/YrhL
MGQTWTGHQRYRADIDGLRAVAVIAVIAYHGFPELMPGGFIGVDVFFVISGYLITDIIERNLAGPAGFSFADFYRRRVRRIFPALVVVLFASLAVGVCIFLPSELSSLTRNAIASAFSSANLILLSEAGYFDVDAHLKPLLHLWSLGIEEQFYLAWPLALWLTPRRWRGVLIGIVIVGSFALNIILVKTHPQATFYLPFTRAWELIAGAALVHISIKNAKLTEALSALGFACGIAFFLYNSRMTFPGWAALVPVIGTSATILGEGSFFNRVVLSHPLAVLIGRISYPLYLWHWPLLVFTGFYLLRPLTPIEIAGLIVAAFVLAWLTYELIERPIRSGRMGSVKTALAGMLATVTFAGVTIVAPPQLPEAIKRFATITTGSAEWRIHECLVSDNEDFAPSCIDHVRPLIALWGDSTAGALMPGLRNLQSHYSFGIAQFTVSSCSPIFIVGSYSAVVPSCLERNQKILRNITELHPDMVLLQALWTTTHDELNPTISALRSAGISRIVIIGRSPMWPGGFPNAVATYYRRTRELLPERTNLFVEPQTGADPMMGIAESVGVEYISARDAFCDKDGCIARIGQDPVVSDWLHLTPVGSRYLMNKIGPALLRQLPKLGIPD